MDSSHIGRLSAKSTLRFMTWFPRFLIKGDFLLVFRNAFSEKQHAWQLNRCAGLEKADHEKLNWQMKILK
jgi:hypothetical protein